MAGKAGAHPLWALLAAAALLALLPLWRRRGWGARWALLCTAFLCAGMCLGHARAEAWRGRGGAAGEVVVLGEVGIGSRGGRDDAVDLLRVVEVLGGEGARAGDGYLMRRKEGAEAPRWGDRLRVRGRLFVFTQERGGVGGTLLAEEVEVISHARNPLLRAALAYRASFRAGAENMGDPAAAGLIQGMVLGDYRLLEARDLRAFRMTGLIHLCAASGLHLAFLAAFLVWLGRRARLPPRWVMLLQVPVIAVYALAVGLSVPIIRAAVVAFAAAAAYLLGRDFDLLPAMGLAMFLLVWEDAAAASGVSFQLCFLAALGMALLYRPLGGKGGPRASRLRELLAATLAAQMAVAPVLLYHFGEVSLLAPLSNLLVLPLVPAVMALSMLSSLLGAAGLPLAGALMSAAGFLARGVLAVARALSSPHWAALRIYPLSPLWMAAYYPALAAGLLARGKARRWGRAALALLLAIALLVGTPASLLKGGAERGTRITVIDVGQGDAILFQMSSGATVLVDGGMEVRVLREDLRARGVRCIDAVIVSHPDADHIGGLECAFEDCVVGMLIHPGTRSSVQAEKLIALAEETGAQVRIMRVGDVLALEELSLVAHGPPREVPEDASVNDYSLVLRAAGPGFSMLLTGDIAELGQEMLLEGEEDIACDILKVPHHGGYCEESGRLFLRADPGIAVISVGENNPYGHPARDTLALLERMGCAVYRTDMHGDIVIRVVQGGYRVECDRR